MFGSIISGTMRPQDLIPAFLDELDARDPEAYEQCLNRAIPAYVFGRYDDSGWWQSEDADYLLQDLFDALNDCAPAYGYFGAHPDDGALFVADTSEIPGGYSGEVVHVNDHGNATLYSCTNGELSEVWAVV